MDEFEALLAVLSLDDLQKLVIYAGLAAWTVKGIAAGTARTIDAVRCHVRRRASKRAQKKGYSMFALGEEKTSLSLG